ncbi:AmmeMemoRadiSam system protein A [Methylomonas koyamae]|uniref:AmmeMemoRadiSam system protein A n=1 Tax=Methylomonas koyamae TaxID=702114 RepID=UPI00112B7BCA|nr:AmmeMemoRadiSam system protein A [Methylomonas koyamae]TPQ25440.1 AMMECR1 domain-containing protein [Methylomonas koyamae]
MSLTDDQRQRLLALARHSISHGLETGRPSSVDPAQYAGELSARRATFVTLERAGQLRGCIGMLEARRPLAEDVAENAFAAAFRDPRFPPLRDSELAGLDLHISVLTPAEPLPVKSEADLLQQLRPGVDGLILEEGGRRATFLPAVWDDLPEPARFLNHLKQKAGLPAAYWSDSLRFFRYTTESFG